ncbi:hypothetical protein RYA05_02740 [Pseudomonas syringae pv. actinidiae]|nr:hypothetical protein [Pseudomonas syringae pv. actinidiae]
MIKLSTLKSLNDSEEHRARFSNLVTDLGQEEFERVANMAVKHMEHQGLSEAFQVGPFLSKDVIKIAEGIDGFIVLPAGTVIQRIDPRTKLRLPVFQFRNHLLHQKGESFKLEESFIVNVNDVWTGWLEDHEGVIHESRTRIVIDSRYARFIYLIDFEQWWSLGGEKASIDFRSHWRKEEAKLAKNWDKLKDCFEHVIGKFTEDPKPSDEVDPDAKSTPPILKYNLDTMEERTMGRFMNTCKGFAGSEGLY